MTKPKKNSKFPSKYLLDGKGVPLKDEDDKKIINKEFFKAIGKRGGDATKHKYGSEFFYHIGVKGGQSLKTHNQDHEFFRRIGAMGGRGKRKGV